MEYVHMNKYLKEKHKIEESSMHFLVNTYQKKKNDSIIYTEIIIGNIHFNKNISDMHGKQRKFPDKLSIQPLVYFKSDTLRFYRTQAVVPTYKCTTQCS